jgi:intein/homing endonuclease
MDVSKNTQDLWENCEGVWKIPTYDLYIKCVNCNNQIVTTKVKQLYKEYIHFYIKQITLEDGKSISVTFSHKFYVKKDNNYIWTNLVMIGDEICIYENRLDTSKIVNIIIQEYDDYVYDLEIEHYHNYVANNIIVHNTCSAIAIAEKFKTKTPTDRLRNFSSNEKGYEKTPEEKMAGIYKS